MLYIIAGDFKQATYWARQWNLKHGQWKYVESHFDIRGVSGQFVEVGPGNYLARAGTDRFGMIREVIELRKACLTLIDWDRSLPYTPPAMGRDVLPLLGFNGGFDQDGL